MDIVKKIQDYALEEIMGDRFSKYAKEIIQDRAIPDVRDGLKPVQRRILYAMYKAGNTSDRGYIKCAATVGDVLGKYHPHGDSSVYDAMVRMSQWWKQNHILVDIHGNNGSMDGDSPAAYRYTEARLSKISNELLKDLEKNTVSWAPNFDDRFLEPTVLPAKYPNLLVNGTNGISAGYATNIPPHNLGEVIDATIKRIDSPNCRLETILEIIKGPDFPTGGIVEGKKGIIDAFQTGRGKVIIRSKCAFVKEKGKNQIIITEIPFEVNKASLVSKIDSIRIDKKIDGISEVRDETDRDGLRIAIDLKNNANKEMVLNYLFKNTELQISYNYNMVAISNRRPVTLGILEMLDAYINHQKEVLTRRTQFDLNAYQKRLHIVLGFLKMISILDQVIKVIRKSKNKLDAKDNLVKEFDFSVNQAEAIVTLQLYRLTNTDVVALEEEKSKLEKFIEALNQILNDKDKFNEVMKHELRKVKKEYAIERKTVIKDEITEIKIDTTDMIPKEDCVVMVTSEGYVKRCSLRSYQSAVEPTLKDQDYILGLYHLNTLDTVLLFTNLGNYLYLPVYLIPDLKWKDIGKHISNIIKLAENEYIINSIPVDNFNSNKNITIFSKNGMVKRTLLKDFKVSRYNKTLTCMKLKENDTIVSVSDKVGREIFITTKCGYALRYNINEIGVVGIKASGVKAINLKDDEVVSASIYNGEDYVVVLTDRSTIKRVKLIEFPSLARARKGIQIIREVKTNPYHIINSYIINNKNTLGIRFKDNIEYKKVTDIPILDRYSTGTSLSNKKIINMFVEKKLLNSKEEKENEEEINDVSLEKIDEKIMTIDDFLNEIE